MLDEDGVVDFSVFGQDNSSTREDEREALYERRQPMKPQFSKSYQRDAWLQGSTNQVQAVRERLAQKQQAQEQRLQTVDSLTPDELKNLIVEAIIEAHLQLEEAESGADPEEHTLGLSQVQENLLSDADTRNLHDALGGIIQG